MSEEKVGTKSDIPDPATDTRDEEVFAQWELVVDRLGPLEPILKRVDLSLSARKAAISAGFASTHLLNRWLRSQQLPPFDSLRDWYYVEHLTNYAHNGGSLAAFALQRNQYPSIYYRFLDRVTGHAWGVVRKRGVTWVREAALRQWNHWIS